MERALASPTLVWNMIETVANVGTVMHAVSINEILKQ